MTQTISQKRHEAAWHEAAHLVVAWREGLPISSAQILGEDGEPLHVHAGDAIGEVAFDQTTPIASLAEAIGTISFFAAGDAGPMIAISVGAIDDDDLGVLSDPSKPLNVDHILMATSPETTPTLAAVHYGHFRALESPDHVHARELAGRFTSRPEEADALVRYCRERAISYLLEPKTQYVIRRVAGALLELDSLEGAHAMSLVERWGDLYREPEQEQA